MGTLEPLRVDHRTIGLLLELHHVLTVTELRAMLERLDENRYALARDFRINVHLVQTVDVLCRISLRVPRPEVLRFLEYLELRESSAA